MHSKELVKGTLQIIILKLLSQNEKMYGYEMTQKVKEITQQRIQVTEGALYTILHRLVAEGILTTENVSIGKRVRIYYRLTETGKPVAEDKIREINEFMQSLQMIFHFKLDTL